MRQEWRRCPPTLRCMHESRTCAAAVDAIDANPNKMQGETRAARCGANAHDDARSVPAGRCSTPGSRIEIEGIFALFLHASISISISNVSISIW